MNRKEFIQKTLGASLAMMSPSLFTACDDDDPVTDDVAQKSVLIIGAGIAGLAAANRLLERGFKNVTILEAQNRIGGRIQTDRSLGVPLDLGAAWIHGPSGNPLSPIAKKILSPTFVTNDDSLSVYDKNGQTIDNQQVDDAYTKYEALLKKVVANGNSATSVESVINKIDANALSNPLMKYQLGAYLEFDTGGDISLLSSKEFDNDEVFSGADVLLPEGYDALINHLSKNITIELNSIVESVDYQGTTIKIKTNKGEKTAQYCLCTLPLGVLQSKQVTFNPALSNHFPKGLQNLKMGNVCKVVASFDTCFWDEKKQYIGYAGDEKGLFPYFINTKTFLPNQNILIGFALGGQAEIVDKMSSAAATDALMQVLKKIYGNNIPSPKKIIKTDWSQNPYSLGAYSFPSLNSQYSDFQDFERVIDKKLLFAGEHTSADYRGTAHGAYLSGIRAANAIN
jgi:monoamine oxidase